VLGVDDEHSVLAGVQHEQLRVPDRVIDEVADEWHRKGCTCADAAEREHEVDVGRHGAREHRAHVRACHAMAVRDGSVDEAVGERGDRAVPRGAFDTEDVHRQPSATLSRSMT
jgi:hypothetical protein